jgi:hypothetical protein
VYPTVSGRQSVIVADFNGDQRLDLAVLSGFPNRMETVLLTEFATPDL